MQDTGREKPRKKIQTFISIYLFTNWTLVELKRKLNDKKFHFRRLKREQRRKTFQREDDEEPDDVE